MRVHKLSIADGGRVAVASDFHFQHTKDFVWKSRGFASSEEHDARLLADLRTLTPNDVLLFLGDFSLNSSAEASAALLRQIPARILYIWGNHESWVGRIYRTSLRAAEIADTTELHPIVWEHVTFLGHNAMVRIGSRHLFLSHFAHHCWIHQERGVWHLCGHTHGGDAPSLPDAQGALRLDVGVDVALQTVNRSFFFLDEIAAIMARKKTAA